jgi:hypothetical protein
MDPFGYGYPDIQKDIIELSAKPYKVFDQKLKSMKTSGNTVPKWLIFFVPWKHFHSNDACGKFWNDLCRQNQIDMLDLSAPFYALKPGFYPTNEPNLNQHYTAYGNSLIAILLSHYLAEQKRIPNFPSKPSEKTGAKYIPTK